MKEMIHKYEQNGQYIVLDVCSGGVHVVDELTYKLLDYVAPPFAKRYLRTWDLFIWDRLTDIIWRILKKFYILPKVITNRLLFM